MSNQVWGFDFGEVASISTDGPAVGHYVFEITSAKRDVNKSGKPFVNVGCKVVESEDDSQIDRMHWEYLSLEEKRLGFTKSFFENIGLGWVLAPSKGPQDAVGSLFEADVILNGQYKNLRNLAPVEGEEDDPEEPEEAEEVEEEAPPKKKRPAPAKARVGKRR